MLDAYTLTAGAALAGFGLGWLSGRRPSVDPARPMRLVHVNEYTAPMLAPLSTTDADQWQLYTCAFAFHANLLGSFSYRTLAGAGVCRRAAWERYTGLLKDAGIIQAAERSSTTWAGGWCYSKLRAALKHGVIALPYPAGSPPALNSAKLAAQMAQRSAAGTVGTVVARHAHA